MKKVLIAGAAALALLAATPAAAQQQCGPRELVVERLSTIVGGLGEDTRSYGEARQSVAVSGQRVFELWANEETGSWTITMTLPNGNTCIMASGENYTPVDEEALVPIAGERL